MAKYTIQVSAFISILESKTLKIEANSTKEAENLAEKQLVDYIKNAYPRADFDEVYTKIIPEEE